MSQLQLPGFLSTCPVKQHLPDARGDMGREAVARQTNDTCDRTKTIQNNFINSVNISALYIGSTSPLQPATENPPRSLSSPVVSWKATQTQPSARYLQKCNTVARPEMKLFTNELPPTEPNSRPRLKPCFCRRLQRSAPSCNPQRTERVRLHSPPNGLKRRRFKYEI